MVNFLDFLLSNFSSVVSCRSLTVSYCQNAYQLWKYCFMEALCVLWGFKEWDVVVVSFTVDEISREASVKDRLCEISKGLWVQRDW